MKSHHILWNCKCYADDKTIVLCNHPLHCGSDAWGGAGDTSMLKEWALKISDDDWCSLIHHCVGKGADDLRMLSWKFPLETPEVGLYFFVDNRGCRY